MDNTVDEQEQRKKLTCPICKCTFPNKEFYDSHHLVEAKIIADELVEEFPQLLNSPALLSVEDKKREIKDIERQIKFIEETKQRQARFIEEQRQSEIRFIEEQQQREDRKKKGFEELKAILAEGKTPTPQSMYRWVSED